MPVIGYTWFDSMHPQLLSQVEEWVATVVISGGDRRPYFCSSEDNEEVASCSVLVTDLSSAVCRFESYLAFGRVAQLAERANANVGPLLATSTLG